MDTSCREFALIVQKRGQSAETIRGVAMIVTASGLENRESPFEEAPCFAEVALFLLELGYREQVRPGVGMGRAKGLSLIAKARS